LTDYLSGNQYIGINIPIIPVFQYWYDKFLNARLWLNTEIQKGQVGSGRFTGCATIRKMTAEMHIAQNEDD
jgi:hypothetical protein